MTQEVERITDDSYLVHHGDGRTTPFYRGPYCVNPKQEAYQWAATCQDFTTAYESGLIPNPLYV